MDVMVMVMVVWWCGGGAGALNSHFSTPTPPTPSLSIVCVHKTAAVQLLEDIDFYPFYWMHHMVQGIGATPGLLAVHGQTVISRTYINATAFITVQQCVKHKTPVQWK